MKLAKVIHVHCHRRDFDELETYVWIPDTMTEADLLALATLAREAYDQAGVDFENAEVPPHVGWLDYSKFPDKTVAEVNVEHNAAQAKLDDWRKRKAEAQADFSHHLAAVGNGEILPFWKPNLPTAELDWGHRHGQKIAHGETTLRDMPGSVEREDDDMSS